MTLLTVTGLHKSFGGVVAARDVTFSLERGEMLAIIGPNGAGKSTVVNLVGGQLRPVSVIARRPSSCSHRSAWRTRRIPRAPRSPMAT